jgi:hypothetical protein
MVAVLVIGLFTPTLVLEWAPVLHWACDSESEVVAETVQIPALLLNSPFGGQSWANVTLPVGYIPGDLISQGTQDSNGGAAWAGFEANVTIYRVANLTEWGPGSNVRCTAPYSVDLKPLGNPSVGIPIMGPGNESDQKEPQVLFPGQPNLIYFVNGFRSASAETISTCGGPSQSVPVTSFQLNLWARFVLDGRNQSVGIHLPIVETNFHYLFPANYGTWQVDDLNLGQDPPGGGLAFAYTPCA